MKELERIESVPMQELRDQVLERLTRHYSSNAITMEDYERRARDAAQAETRAALIAVVADLPALHEQGAATLSEERAASSTRSERRPVQPQRGEWRIATDTPPAEDSLICIFSGADRRGVWRVPLSMDSVCVFGGANLDLRKAIVPAEGVTINCIALFGGLDIIVPPGMRLEVRGNGIMGGFDQPHHETEDPDAPLVRIEGFAIFGGVSVRVKE